jgi:hypothetical protein
VAEDNIVPFPRPYDGPPRTPEEAVNILEFVKGEFADELVEFCNGIIYSNLDAAGIKVDDESLAQDWAMVQESILSLILKNYGVYHPIQSLAEKIDFSDSDLKVSVIEKEEDTQ